MRLTCSAEARGGMSRGHFVFTFREPRGREVTTMAILFGAVGLIALVAVGVALLFYHDRRQQRMRRY